MTLPGTEPSERFTVQRLDIGRAVIAAVRGHLEPRLVQSLEARQLKGNDCWEGPILVRTPTQVGIAWLVGHVGRSAIASGGNVHAPVHVEFESNMRAVGFLINQFSPPGPEWRASPAIPLDAAFNHVRSCSRRRGRGEL